MKNLLLIVFLTFFVSGYAQYSKVNFALKIALEKEANQDKLFPLFVMGNVGKIKQEVERLKGEVVRSAGNIVQVKLPVHTIEGFSKNTFVQSIPYSFSSGVALSDTMTIHNNITPIHNGTPPLLSSYRGKNVVFGMIDTGIDIEHGDFKDTSGNTRIYRIWDQVAGLTWDSASINNATCTHVDYGSTSHGTHVTGIAAGNGNALNMYAGAATEATIVAVASDFNVPNWLSTVVDAVNYIYSVADSLNMPCVINASIGDYYGSHDGTDPAAYLIDSIVNYKPGRAFVCAGGNAGFFNWHVEQVVTSDTSFSFLKYNPSSALGFGSVFFEVWSDTADFNNVDYAFGANLPSGSFEERGRTPFVNIQNRLGTFTDTIKNGSNILAIVETYGEIQGDKYLLQVLMNEPDSNTYNFSMLSTGSGRYDFWSTNLLGTSKIVETGLPTIAQYPPMAYYTLPDSAKTTVSSFTCHPNMLTVANFFNRKTYIDVDTIERVRLETPGEKGVTSSLGPDRRGNIKPDIGATGDITIGPNSAAVIAANLPSPDRYKIALGGMHRINGGTSMASPVIAGITAMYFEKCPNATMAEVKAAILNTAKQDTFTGIVPNNAFGYGKVDAFAALNTSNYTLSLGPDQTVCDGDSVQITAPGYNSYLWSTGDTNSSIYIDTSSMAYVSVTNVSGCLGVSDTINIIWKPLPIKPVITLISNDSLIYSTNLNLQWYFNSNVIAGETDTLHIALNNGDYFVQVTDSFGCSNNSDTVSLTTIGIEDVESSSFSIYPNPSTGNITIQLSDNEINQILMINALGEVMIDRKINENQKKIEFDVTHFAQGSYYIKLKADKEVKTYKIVLLR